MQHDRPCARALHLLRWRFLRAVYVLSTVLAVATGQAAAAMAFPSGGAVHSVLAADSIWLSGQTVLSEEEARVRAMIHGPIMDVIIQDLTQFSVEVSLMPQREGMEGAVHVAAEANRPIQPIAPLPSTLYLFGPGAIGILGMLLGQDFRSKVARAGGNAQGRTALSGRTIPILVSSADSGFAWDVAKRLSQAGHVVRVAPTTDDILVLAKQASPALMLIDQRMSDWDILRTDSKLKHIPIMLLVPAGTAYTDADTLLDLERGADGVHLCQDSWRVFLARVDSYLRRAGYDVAPRGVYRVGAVELDADTREVKVEGQRVQLSAKPFALLKVFMGAPSRIFSRSELVDLVWGPAFAIGEHTLDVHIHAIRQQLDRDPHHRCRLINIKNVGFKLTTAAPSTWPLVSPRVTHEVLPFSPVPTRRSLTADRISKGRQDMAFQLRAGGRRWSNKGLRRSQTRPNRKAVVKRYVRPAVSAG